MPHSAVLILLTLFCLQTCQLHHTSGLPSATPSTPNLVPAPPSKGPLTAETVLQHAVKLGNQIAELLRTQIALLGKISGEPSAAVDVNTIMTPPGAPLSAAAPGQHPVSTTIINTYSSPPAGHSLTGDLSANAARTGGLMYYHPHSHHSHVHHKHPETGGSSDQIPFSIAQESIKLHGPDKTHASQKHNAQAVVAAGSKPSAVRELTDPSSDVDSVDLSLEDPPAA